MHCYAIKVLKVSQNHLHISQNQKHLFEGKIPRTDIKIYEIYSQNLAILSITKNIDEWQHDRENYET